MRKRRQKRQEIIPGAHHHVEAGERKEPSKKSETKWPVRLFGSPEG